MGAYEIIGKIGRAGTKEKLLHSFEILSWQL